MTISLPCRWLPLLGVLVISTLSACSTVFVTDQAKLQPGQLVTVQRQTRSILSEAADNWAVSFVSTAHTGESTVVQGLVAIPRTPQPTSGYPVISWGAGTSGYAPQCAPSLTTPPARLEFFNDLLKQGYAVLRADYEGWGAQAGRPILHGRSNAYAIADLVVAAHALPVKLSNDWAAAGHSEGGGAVLWAASMKDRTTNYPLKGALALAPTGPGVLTFMTNIADGAPASVGAQPFISVTALAGQLVDPSIVLSRLVPQAMNPQIEVARSTCLSGMYRMPLLQPGQYLNKGADFDKLSRFLQQQDPSQLTMQVPVAIMQGEKDETTVTPPTTKLMIRALCSKGARVHYKEYADETHGSVVQASVKESLRFLDAVFKGEPTANDCP